jgi:hypothetical protein
LLSGNALEVKSVKRRLCWGLKVRLLEVPAELLAEEVAQVGAMNS